MSDTQIDTHTPDPETVDASTWAVWILGMDDVLPALGRTDAFVRAHEANTAAVHIETHSTPKPSDRFRPVVWAQPCEYGPGSPVGEISSYTGWTADQVDEAWKQWAE